MPVFATLCYLRNRDKVLLLRKARGLFGEGKWNAPRGKLRLGENPSNGAVREMLEETGLRVNRLRFNGILNFYLEKPKELDQTVFAFSCHKFTGKARRGREGKLRWFPIGQIPYDDMWEDDRLWRPLLLDGRSFIGDFYFTDKYQKLIDHKIHQNTESRRTIATGGRTTEPTKAKALATKTANQNTPRCSEASKSAFLRSCWFALHPNIVRGVEI